MVAGIFLLDDKGRKPECDQQQHRDRRADDRSGRLGFGLGKLLHFLSSWFRPLCGLQDYKQEACQIDGIGGNPDKPDLC
jgi:hypothetical protein